MFSYRSAPGREISQAGLDTIKSLEGLRLHAYRDSGDIWTIGYGHTGGVHPGDIVTLSQAEALLRRDLRQAERAVVEQVLVPLNDNQFAALVSFTYNVGPTGLTRSGLLQLLRAHKFLELRAEFLRHITAGGVPSQGLLHRRQVEIALFYR